MQSPAAPHGILELARVLVLLQGAVLVATTLEALVWAGFFRPTAGPSIVLSGGSAALTLAAAWALGRPVGRLVRLARRWTLIAETGVIALALIDLGLAFAIAGAPFGLVPALTRLAIPIAVIVLLRQPTVRAGLHPASQ